MRVMATTREVLYKTYNSKNTYLILYLNVRVHLILCAYMQSPEVRRGLGSPGAGGTGD